VKFISYAQNFEDVILWRALNHVEAGFYIDVGAFSPDVDSVTRAFSERGWRGINIEPNPSRLAELCERRPDDLNLGVAASDADGQIDLNVVGDTGLTTVDASLARKYSQSGLTVTTLRAPARTLASIWDEHVPDAQPVHFLKVDVEGHEAAVLRGADWTRHRPWIVVVESTVPTTETPSHEESDAILTGAGYRFVYFDGLSRFYLARECDHLSGCFGSPPNVFDDFVLGAQLSAMERAARSERRLDDQALALKAAEQENAGLRLRTEQLGHRLELSEQALRTSEDEGRRLQRTLDEADEAARRSHRQLAYVLGRPVWERLLFRPSGKPKRLARRLLFHASGKPRGIFRRWVLRGNGRPRGPFTMWMSSPEYMALPRAIMPPDGRKSVTGTGDPSPRTQYFLRRIDAAARRPWGW